MEERSSRCDLYTKCSHLLCYTLGMGVEWTSSASKHGVTREDALYAMTNAEVSVEVKGFPGQATYVFIGHPHAQTARWIEVIAAYRQPRTFTIFHVMPLSDKYRHLLD